MKSCNQVNVCTLLIGCLFLLPELSNAATEYSTFNSFYFQPLNPIWIIAGASAAAVLGVAFIIFTGGTASPAVASMGTWLGGLMGYSGIAATNAGLAMLGGGSIASGGLGVLGGTALLTAAFSFSTTAVVDYAATKAVEIYDYSKFVDSSKKMATLPLPKNTSGPESYEAGMKVLEKANNEESLFTNHNQAIIQEAIKTIRLPIKDKLSGAEKSREQSLLGLLHFTSNNYVLAKDQSASAYNLAINGGKKATFPAFIYATSMLYDLKPDFNKSLSFFKYSLVNEPHNPITPLLFRIYLDRMMYRINDGYLNPIAIDKVYALSGSLPYNDRKALIQSGYLGLIDHYFFLIKREQQKIIIFTDGNKEIKDSPKTLVEVKNSLKYYKLLLTSLNLKLDDQSKQLDSRIKRQPKFFDKLRDKDLKDWEIKWNKKIIESRTLWSSYFNGIAGLESQVRELERHQAELERARLEKEKLKRSLDIETKSKDNRWGWWAIILLIGSLLLLIKLLLRRCSSNIS